MKILTIYTKSPFPSNDGGTLASASLLQMMAHLDIDLTCLVMSTPKHPFRQDKIPDQLREKVEFHGLPINTQPSIPGALGNLLRTSSYHFQRFFDKGFSHSLSQFLSSQTYDAVLLDGLYAAPYLPLIRKVSHAKVILRAHNVEHEIWLRYADQVKNPLKKWYFRLQAGRLAKEERGIAKQVDGILPISPLDEEFFQKNAQDAKITTIPFALDFEQYPAGKSTQKQLLTVAHIGAMDWLPNQEGMHWFLEEVWPKVINEVPQAQFYLAGRHMPGWMNEWQKPGVHIAGEVESAIDFMNEHGLFVVPLFSGSGLRIKILEAMALGKPVIATKLAAGAIDAEDGSHILLADDPTAFAQHVITLLQDAEKAQTIGRQARKLVQNHYEMKQLTQQLAAFLKRLGL